MLDQLLAREALRARLLTLVVASTGTATLSATTAGYARASGSFLDDGFAAGMEVTPAGFPTNAVKMIESVTALLVTITGGLSAVTAAGSRSLTVGLPAMIEWDGTQTPATTAVATRPKLLEQWVPATSDPLWAPMLDGGQVDTGLWVLTWFGLANKGLRAMMRQMQAIRELFPPGLRLAAGDDFVKISGGSTPGQMLTTENGYITSTIRIPWRAVSAIITA